MGLKHNEEVMSVRLGAMATLDIVRFPGEHKYLVVFAERGPIQRRSVVALPDDEAAKVGRFLQGQPRSPFEQLPVPEEVEPEITDTVVADIDLEPTKVGG